MLVNRRSPGNLIGALSVMCALLLTHQPAALADTALCAQLAGSRAEPNFRSGVSYAELQADAAIAACKSAVSNERTPANLYRLSRALYKAERFEESMTLSREAAESDYAPALGLLGFAYYVGNSVTEIDYPRALTLFEKALNNGFGPAANNLGYAYSQAVGADRDYEKAVDYYLAGIDLGDAQSQYGLGWLYKYVKALGKSSVEAVALFKLSAEQNYGPAILELGIAHEWGDGLPQSLDKASAFYQQAADKGAPNAAQNLQRLQQALAYQSDIHINDWAQAEPTIAEAVLAQDVVQELADVLPEPVIESLYLPFYDAEVKLIRANFGPVANAPVASYFLHKGEQLVHLNGASTPIHEFNSAHPPYLHAAQFAEHYLWFFGFFVRSDINEPFLLIGSSDDVLIPDALTQQELATLKAQLQQHHCDAADDQQYQCQADVYYKNSVFRAQMSVAITGKVAMSDDKPIASNLSQTVSSPITLAEVEQYIFSLPEDTPISPVEMNLISGLLTAQVESELDETTASIESLNSSISENERLVRENEAALAAVEAEMHLYEALKIMATEGRTRKAYDKLALAAEHGFPEAKHELSMYHLLGEVVEKDSQRGMDMLRKNAEDGFLRSQFAVGEIQFLGLQGDINTPEAVHFYTLAAEQGHEQAQYVLGEIYDLGKGVPQDYAKAIKWYQLAAEQGHKTAQFNLGIKYDYGRGVAQDRSRAHQLYVQAAEQGYANAQFAVGNSYTFGKRGVAISDREAVKWYRLAAEQGFAAAQGALGVRYVNGSGVSKDRDLGIEWLKKAAEQGNENAIKNLETLGAR